MFPERLDEKPLTSSWPKELKLQEIEEGEKAKFDSDDDYDEDDDDYFEYDDEDDDYDEEDDEYDDDYYDEEFYENNEVSTHKVLSYFIFRPYLHMESRKILPNWWLVLSNN